MIVTCNYSMNYWGIFDNIPDVCHAICLTHWGRVTLCVSKLTIIGSDNGLSPGRRQAIIWTNAGILLIRSLGTNPNEILIGILTFSFKRMHLKMLSAKWRLFCLGLNVLLTWTCYNGSSCIINTACEFIGIWSCLKTCVIKCVEHNIR